MRIIERMEEAQVSVASWLAGFAGIVFVRFFLENFSDPTASFPAVFDALTLVHYALFYMAELLALALVIRAFAKTDIARITKVLLFGFCTLWIAPIVDLAVAHGAGAASAMAYIFAAPSALVADFFTLGGPAAFGGVTAGIKTELVLAMLLIAGYVWLKTRRPLRAILAAIAGYAAIFIMLSLPSWIALAGSLSAPGAASTAYSVQNFLLTVFGTSHIGPDFIMANVQYSFAHAVEAVFSLGMATVFFILDAALAVAWFAAYKKSAFMAVARNVRPARIAHYLVMTIIGLIIAVAVEHPSFNGFDAAAFLMLLVGIAAAWCFAVGVNDAADVAIDSISNPDRPLVAGTVAHEDMRGATLFFLIAALTAGYLAGYWALFCIIAFLAVFYIHAAPPLRLKRVPGVAAFLIALASLASVMAGFYFADANHLLADFPGRVALLIVVCFTLGLNFKDMKDIEGDRAEGVMTVPVIFGEYGAEVTGGLLACAFLAVPAILGSWPLFIPSLIAAIIGYLVIVAKPYREWKVFVLWFCYLAVFAAMTLVH